MTSARGVMRAAVAAAAALLLAAAGARAEDWCPLWTTANLSLARFNLAATSAGGKVFFGGGYTSGGPSSRVDIYDTATGAWSTADLSQARQAPAATSAGGKLFFGGGYDTAGEVSRWVDIYDAATGGRSTASLSQARANLCAASAGGKAFFAGGTYGIGARSNRVDIYDTATGAWSTASLSVARSSPAAASAGDLVFFGGGYAGGGYPSDIVDIYDTATGAWSTERLSLARTTSAASAGGKVLFGGGNGEHGYVDRVDIYDTATGAWSTASLSVARSASAVSAGSKVFFAGGWTGSACVSTVDICDTATGAWSTASLSQARRELASASAGNKVFFAGGHTGAPTDTIFSLVDIYTLQNYGTITSTQAWTLVDHTTVTGRMQLNGGSLNLDGFDLAVGSMSGVAPIDLGSQTLTVGSDGTSSTYAGALSGHGGLLKTGAGTLTLSGTSSCDGTTRVSGGALNVTGSIAASSVLVDGGTLQGTGRVGAITGTSGRLHPGGSPGILASAGLAMSPAFRFDACLDGPTAGTGYSQLDVTGTVDLGGATLDAAVGYAPAWYSGGGPPDLLYIIKNDGADPVIGRFDALPQMSEFDLLYNGTPYEAMISYQGDYDAGTLTGGNDVVVALPEPATLSLLVLGVVGALLRRRGK